VRERAAGLVRPLAVDRFAVAILTSQTGRARSPNSYPRGGRSNPCLSREESG
jgi:hypothetical protein